MHSNPPCLSVCGWKQCHSSRNVQANFFFKVGRSREKAPLQCTHGAVTLSPESDCLHYLQRKRERKETIKNPAQ